MLAGYQACRCCGVSLFASETFGVFQMHSLSWHKVISCWHRLHCKWRGFLQRLFFCPRYSLPDGRHVAFAVVHFELTVITFLLRILFLYLFHFLMFRLSVSAISRYFTDVIYLSEIPYHPSVNRERYSQFASVGQLFPIGTSLFALGLRFFFATICCLLAGLVCTLSVFSLRQCNLNI